MRRDPEILNREEVQKGHDDFDRIRRIRWLEGREKYGEQWHGKPPLEEGIDELLDLANYIDAAVTMGYIDDEQLAVTLYDETHLLFRRLLWAINKYRAKKTTQPSEQRTANAAHTQTGGGDGE